MRKSLFIKILIFSFGLSTSVFAADTGKGTEISAEQKSEQGLEHGDAYAGTKEKKEKDDKDKGDKEKKEKNEKDKGDKEKKEKNDKDKGDKEKRRKRKVKRGNID